MNFALQLLLDILASWGRMLVALGLSVAFSVFVGIAAATSKRAEGVVLPAIDVLQTIPILGFFPVVIFLLAPLGSVGLNASVVLLIFTSMAWNITFGVYEAVKSIPEDMLEIARINRLSGFQTAKGIYVPAALPRIAYQATISWSVGLFYLVTSEIFSAGSRNFAATYGIGVEIARLVVSGNPAMYVEALAFLAAAVILTWMLLFRPLESYAERFSFREEQRPARRSRLIAAYSGIGRFVEKVIHEPRARETARAEQQMPRAKPAHAPARRKPVSRVASAAVVLCLVALAAGVVVGMGAYSFVPVLLEALAASFVRVWGVYLLCVAIAVPLGIKMAKSPGTYRPLIAVLEVVASIPATVLLPALVALLFVLPFGNELSALAIIFLAMIWYLLFSVIAGIRTMPEQFSELLKIFGTDWVGAWREVYIPAMLPSFVTGSITAIGGAWNALIVAEYFSIESGGSTVVLTQVGSGIGKLLDIATFQGNFLEMFLALAAMVVMVMVINKLVWQRLYRDVTRKYKIEV
jgi:NitT/TauT family transport system permease protein